MKTIKSILATGTGLVLSLNLLNAQQADLSNSNVNLDSASDLQAMLQAIESVPPIPFANLSRQQKFGTFWSAQHPPSSRTEWPPLPGNIFGLPVWPISDGNFILDDRSVDYSALSSSMLAGGVASPAFGGSSPSYIPDAFAFGIGLQETNIVLHWTSQTNRLYLIDHRPTLTSETHWSILGDYLLAATDTNVTTYIHTNIVQTQPIDFYWLFDVTPVAHDDFFAVDQDSSANQLDIFQNDTDPNGDPIYIANVGSPQHGSITNSLDASTFQYTPDPGFYGVDLLC